jgi:hypothetical protein
MSWRIWFTETNTDGLSRADLAIINRAARRIIDQGSLETHALLMEIRMTYRTGMSAQDVIDALNHAHNPVSNGY